MPKSTLANQTHALITLFLKLWSEKYKSEYVMNRYREKWGFQSMIEDLGYDRSRQVVEYYFRTKKPGHPLAQLLFNYDKYSQILKELDEDDVRRAVIRAETKQRVEEWERLHGN